MGFKVGNKVAKGGRRPGAGRPTEDEKTWKESLKEEIEKQASAIVDKITGRYLQRALGKNGDKVLLHLIDTAIPKAVDAASNPPAFPVAFVQFNYNSLQLPAQAVPATILASNGEIGNGQERGNGLASEVGQGQDGPKFLDFKDVPGKHRR